MVHYELRISRAAETQLRRLPKDDQSRIARAMLGLGEEPFPRGTRKMAGYDDVFRIRVGRYRILYSVDGSLLVIIILKLGHRRDVYR